MTFLKKQFSDDLFSFRAKKVLSRQMVADAVGVSCSQIQQLEEGGVPKLEPFWNLCEFMEVEPQSYFVK